VSNLDPPPKELEVSLDHRRTGPLGAPQRMQIVTGPVSDDERSTRPGGIQGRHRGRV
jgi:hypothetical protein